MGAAGGEDAGFGNRAAPLRLLVFGHEATRSGAALQLLQVVQRWAGRDDVRLTVLLRRGGELEPAFRQAAPTEVITPPIVVAVRRRIRLAAQHVVSAVRRAPASSGAGPSSTPRRDRLRSLGEVARVLNGRLLEPPRGRVRRAVARSGAQVILLNTGTLGDLVPALGSAPVVCYVHEQHAVLSRSSHGGEVRRLMARSSRIVASSTAVRADLIERYDADPALVEVISPFAPVAQRVARPQARAALLATLDGPADTVVVGACGGLYWAKDPDSFVEVAARVAREATPGTTFRFAWLGGEVKDPERARLRAAVEQRGLSGVVHFLPPRDDPAAFFAALDVFLVVSRSESFGVAALEAAREAVPVVCFDEAAGLAEFVRDDAGFVVTGRDHGVMAQRVLQLAGDPGLRTRLGAAAAARVERDHVPEKVADRLLDVLLAAAGR